MATDESGATLRETLTGLLDRAVMAGNTKRVAELEAQLYGPPLPKSLAYIWTLYHRLRARKGMGFSGAEPVTWADIDAFLRLTRNRLTPWEVEQIELLDAAFLREARNR